jgi:hypothetical protein
MVSVVDRDPLADGEKVSVNVQLAAPTRVEPQVLLPMVKSPELPPELATDNEVAEDALLFVTVNVTGELDIPTVTDPKFSLVGEIAMLPLPLYWNAPASLLVPPAVSRATAVQLADPTW